MLKDLKNHSAINGAYIKFMVQNNNSDEVSTYRSELQCMETKMASIKLEQNNKIKDLTGEIEAGSKIAINASNNVKLLEETVRKLSSVVGNLKKKE